ncbi:OmpL47-type beta-barrel domain-containing protein [Amycolatopsis sp. PS_44_ISF1]|uniref:OmpL47-type beta-barrel domain-containing protein n=1 Tax=Amycolatopsis sp. PS_44_ISF1 TaxID=2974917 RepID=UPI0028E01BD2|nr:copper-binding protein [Amycolatopsis sp. PS_44_ISF1]MDT8915967.1 copper-binding protein [Amycolatopsis sp. PS_44_ISF1]
MSARKLVVAVLATALALLGLTGPATARPVAAAPVQTLTWTAGNSTDHYLSAPATAVAGETLVLFKNTEALGSTMTHTLTFDTTTPGYNHDVDLNITANPYDDQNGEHQATITLTPGKYRFHCVVQGHEKMVGELVVTGGSPVDTTPPSVTANVTGNRDTGGNYVGSATVNLTATDTQSEVAEVEYQLDGGAWTAYTAPVVVTALGSHMLHYKATDTAGNVSPEAMASFTVVEPKPGDKTPPTVSAEVTGNQDASGNYLDTATVKLTASDEAGGSGLDKVEYRLDDGAWTVYTAPVAVSTPGMRMVHYRASDKAGNQSAEGMAHFTVVSSDTTAPVVTASVAGTKDADGNYVGKATVTLAATDSGSGVGKVEYKVDGGSWLAYSAPVAVSAAGAHTVTYRASDQAGNVSAEGTSTFTIVAGGDTVSPSTSIVVSGNLDADWQYIEDATVTLTAEDNEGGSGVDKIEYKLDSGAWTTYPAPVKVTGIGRHSVWYRASDKAGNVAAEKGGSFIIAEAPAGPDLCPDSDVRETVVLGSADSQVENRDLGDGCTINDTIDDESQYASNSQFVSYVSAVTRELLDAGDLSSYERNRIITAAIDSGIGGTAQFVKPQPENPGLTELVKNSARYL